MQYKDTKLRKGDVGSSHISFSLDELSPLQLLNARLTFYC